MQWRLSRVLDARLNEQTPFEEEGFREGFIVEKVNTYTPTCFTTTGGSELHWFVNCPINQLRFTVARRFTDKS